MNGNRKYIWLALVLIAAAGVGWWFWRWGKPAVEQGWVEDVVVLANGRPLGETLSFPGEGFMNFNISFRAAPGRTGLDTWGATVMFGQPPIDRRARRQPWLHALNAHWPDWGVPLLGYNKPPDLPSRKAEQPPQGRFVFTSQKTGRLEKDWDNPFPPVPGEYLFEISIYPHVVPETVKTDYDRSVVVHRRTVEVVPQQAEAEQLSSR